MRLKNKLLTIGCVALSAGALLASGLACNEHELSPFSKSLNSGTKQSTSSGSTRQVDILFVIDNSNSMLEEQQSLDKNFGEFLTKLTQANANFRLAAVSTDYQGANMAFETDALSREGAASVLGLPSSEIEKIKATCKSVFSKDKPWIDYEDLSKEGRLDMVQDLFRCEAMMGTKGSGLEKGLASMRSVLETKVGQDFKRPGSIMAIVFVTDENDCSSSKITQQTSTQLQLCETSRNIEDSCIMTRFDRVKTSNTTGSTLVIEKGQYIEYTRDNNEVVTKSLREWCVQGDVEARDALKKCYESEDCAARNYIDCPNGQCGDGILDHRRDFFDFILDYVGSSNEQYYRDQNPDAFAKMETAADHKELIDSFAKSDVIVASIINRDEGMRFNDKLPENWCGTAGSQSYRYQLFAEMFGNDPIYAPICCKRVAFKTLDGETLKTVCSGDKNDVGKNGEFGPVLAAIGERIGKAVNTLCADSMPVTCKPEDCNGDNPSPSCPCLYGCDDSKTYLANTDNAYNLCNEFKFSVGTLPKNSNSSSAAHDESIMNQYSPYKEGTDFVIDYESNYCRARTGSPIQIQLIKSEAGRDLVFEYPKKVSSI
ncbi:MAG: hypothetical protein IKY83_00980 [Proteobacteria bacterium]|nr:hypothetical protein [Pseudomonadota bacterium]